MAWGSTLAAVVREIPHRSPSSIEVVQLAGSSIRFGRGRDAGELARVLADRLGATHRAIYAPAFVEGAALRAALLSEPEVAETVARFGALDLAIVGVGAMPSADLDAASSLLRSGVLDEADVARLAAAGAIGDLVVHSFDAAGQVRRAGTRRTGDRHRRRRAASCPTGGRVASGTRKAAAIRGALADRRRPDARHGRPDGPGRPGRGLMDRLRGRVCLITGSTGIAAAAALRCAAEGASVFIVSRTAEHAQALAVRLTDEGGTAGWAAADLTDEIATEAAVGRPLPGSDGSTGSSPSPAAADAASATARSTR